MMAFEMVCPDRIDLVHKNYRKLCTLLVDVDEWGQVIILNMLTRYARTQFINPNREVSLMGRELHTLNTRCLFSRSVNIADLIFEEFLFLDISKNIAPTKIKLFKIKSCN